MNRLGMALAAYAALALLATFTLTERVDIQGRPVPIVWIVWIVLGSFAIRSWLHHERQKLDERERGSAPLDR